jgi:hypothetical protein
MLLSIQHVVAKLLTSKHSSQPAFVCLLLLVHLFSSARTLHKEILLSLAQCSERGSSQDLRTFHLPLLARGRSYAICCVVVVAVSYLM